MKATGFLICTFALVASKSLLAATPGGPSPERPPERDGWVSKEEIAFLPSTYRADSDGLVIDTVRGGWAEGSLVVDRDLRYEYADSTRAESGVVPKHVFDQTHAGILAAREEKKRTGKCRGRFKAGCLLAVYFADRIFQTIHDQELAEQRSVQQAAATCAAAKAQVTSSINQQSAMCYATRGVVTSVDYGDQCGGGAKVECDYNMVEEPPAPRG